MQCGGLIDLLMAASTAFYVRVTFRLAAYAIPSPARRLLPANLVLSFGWHC